MTRPTPDWTALRNEFPTLAAWTDLERAFYAIARETRSRPRVAA